MKIKKTGIGARCHSLVFPMRLLFKTVFVSGGAGEVHQVCEQPRPDPDGGGPGMATRPALSHEDCALRQERKIFYVFSSIYLDII
jgi:hypothetical protein